MVLAQVADFTAKDAAGTIQLQDKMQSIDQLDFQQWSNVCYLLKVHEHGKHPNELPSRKGR